MAVLSRRVLLGRAGGWARLGQAGPCSRTTPPKLIAGLSQTGPSWPDNGLRPEDQCSCRTQGDAQVPKRITQTQIRPLAKTLLIP